MDQFELIVIGGGPGGYLCAERAAEGGLSVALFEKEHMGGTCLNEGCVPTKAFLNCAKMYHHAVASADFGVTVKDAKLDHSKAFAHKNNVVKTLVGGVEAKMRANKVNVIRACAKIVGRKEEGFIVEADGKQYAGRRLVIATGSTAAVPPITGLKEGLARGFVGTAKEFLDLEKLPKTMVLMGGGVIGLEMAVYYATAGVKVIVVEMLDKIAGPTDKEISNVVLKACEERGIEFHLSTKVTEIKDKSVLCEKDGKKLEIPCDLVLLALGRAPVTADLGLETLQIEMDRRAIKTDAQLHTNVAGVYAIGDCNGKSMLAHTAYREAEVAVHDMLGVKDAVNYNSIPSVIYTDPECSTVGESKESAEAKGMTVQEIKLPLVYSGRYVAENINGKGFIKLVIDMDRKRVVGAHMVGSYASEIIASIGMMVDTEMSIERLKKFVFPHPTVGEVIHDALYSIKF